MPKTYLVHRSKNSELEHATSMSPSRITTAVGNMGVASIGDKIKNPVVASQSGGKTASRIAEVAKVKQKWDKLISQKEAENDSYAKKIETSTKDRNLLINCRGQISDPDIKMMLLNKANQLATNIKSYNTNIAANKKAITSYTTKRAAEIAAANGK